jgi:hypothetical protein
MTLEQTEILAENLVDVLLELEGEGILSLEQTNIIAIKLDLLLVKAITLEKYRQLRKNGKLDKGVFEERGMREGC